MIYAIAHLTITDPAALAAYRERAAPALAQHGGSIVQASGDITAIDGTPVIADAVAVLSFPDKAAAIGWIKDPSLREVHELRRSAGASDIIVLG